MSTEKKKVPAEWKTVMDEETISRSVSRICYEIMEKDSNIDHLAIVGVRTAGEHLALRVIDRIFEIEKKRPKFGVLDITLYRDDILAKAPTHPILKGTDLQFSISGARIILIDDVLYTGRTIRAALDAITDFGRPACVELAVLVDRGHREVPIRPDYIGKNLPTGLDESVRVRLREMGYAEDGVYLFKDKRR